MKKLLMIACMMLASTAMFAEKGATTIGIHGNYMIDSPNNIGAGANVGYEIINNVRGIAEFNYFLKKDHVSFWNVEVNAAYLFQVGTLTVYPLAGIDLLGSKASYEGHSASDSEMGLNLGVGVEYQLSKSMALKAEYNYKTEGDGWSLLKLGVVIPF